ncbi:MAG TPA: RDD family protein [Actinomycetota bacterium]|nr:RDD family protein [Actinomycetota bacterium]
MSQQPPGGPPPGQPYPGQQQPPGGPQPYPQQPQPYQPQQPQPYQPQQPQQPNPYGPPGGQQPYGAPGGQPPMYQPQAGPQGPGGPLAEWWKRLVAAIVDGIIISIPSYIIMLVLGVGYANTAEVTIDPNTGQITSGGGGFLATMLISFAIILALGVAYYAYMNGVRGQTVGKILMKIKVVDENTGQVIGFGKGAIRYIVAGVLWMLCYIPGIVDSLMPLWDAKRQSIHDKVANSVVIEIG